MLLNFKNKTYCNLCTLTATLAFALAFTLSGCGEHSWDNLPNDNSSSSQRQSSDSKPSSVGPLLKTQWGQGDPYNSMFPDTKVNTGCVITAVAQIMKYHEHPKRGKGQSKPYQMTFGIQPSVNFEIDYDWDNMVSTYTKSATEQQKNAVATLVYHLGASRNFDFYISRYSVQPYISLTASLTTVFGYDKSIQSLNRKNYDDAAWETIIREQLDSGLPVYYSGGTHAFVIDGYDNTGKFHVNWGWNGLHDGYYSLNALNPGNSDFNIDDAIYINFKPDESGSGGITASSSSNLSPSSSSKQQSSSSASSSSSKGIAGCTAANNTPTQYCSNGTMKIYGSVIYQGQTYKTVVIGEQTWMAENLNYNVNGSVCHSNNEANCNTYGRLYNWATAMGLASNCNSSRCASQVQAKHQGICPSGWHIPSDDDWDALYHYVDNTSDTSGPYNSLTAGRDLRAKERWKNCGLSGSGNAYLCEDIYGFSALPSGYGKSNGTFEYEGSYAYLWSTHEYSGNIAHSRSIYYGQEYAIYRGDTGKSYLFSIRCLKD